MHKLIINKKNFFIILMYWNRNYYIKYDSNLSVLKNFQIILFQILLIF